LAKPAQYKEKSAEKTELGPPGKINRTIKKFKGKSKGKRVNFEH
jgi:hypothetical protein